MTYRPTVRYSDDFRDYINEVFRATILDRNQIIRLALYVAAHSKEYKTILKQYQRRGDVPIPHPNWALNHHQIWLESDPEPIGKGRNVNVNDSRRGEIKNGIEAHESSSRTEANHNEDRCEQQAARRTGEVLTERRIFSGGIKVTLT